MSHPHRSITILLVAGLLAGCGSDRAPSTSGHAPAAKGTPGSPSNPLRPRPGPAEEEQTPLAEIPGLEHVRRPAGSPRRAATPAPRPAATRPAGEPAVAKPAAAKPAAHAATAAAAAPGVAHPCRLVSRAQAQRILGVRVAPPREAPQGPTCLYQSRPAGSFVTLTVQHVSFAALRRQMRSARRMRVASRTAYCSARGRPVLYVRLARRRVLTVTAPSCTVARRFAVRPLRRL